MIWGQGYRSVQVFVWSDPNWGWFFLGVVAGMLVMALCHRRGGG